jgi:3-hydroxyisobutyrate dehydrogenase-like beta-hydroxyacid dehydrogenase
MKLWKRYKDGVIKVVGSLIKSKKSSGVIVDCSTVDPALVRKLHAVGLASGVGVFDAPVSGGTAGASSQE